MARKVGAQSYYDKTAKFQVIYDKDWYMLAEDERYGRRIAPLFPKDSNVLDLGCGQFYPWPIWNQIKGNVSVYTGIDISKERIRSAQKRVKEGGVDAQLNFVQADFLEYLQKAPENNHDVVTSLHCTLSQINEKHLPVALKSCLKILKPGRYGIFDFLNANALWKPRKSKKVSYSNRGLKNTGYNYPITTYTPEEMEKVIADAGFEIEDKFGVASIECIEGVQDCLTRRQNELEKDGTKDEKEQFKTFIENLIKLDDSDHRFGHTVVMVGRKPL